MKTLIHAAEIWVPDADGYLLEFCAGAYGSAIEFDTTSRALCFGRGEGLPGRVWEEQRPILLDSLGPANFRRAKAAANAGYRAAVGLPFGAQDRLAAIVVLFFGDVATARSAVELWQVDGTTKTSIGRLGMATHAIDGVTDRVTDRTHLSLPIGAGVPAGFELTLAGQPSEPIGLSVARWRREDAPDLSPAGAAAAAVVASGMPRLESVTASPGLGMLALPIVVDDVVTGAVTIAL